MLKAKVETLELELREIVKLFTNFQNFAIESGGILPNVALKLSTMRLAIMNHSNEARDFKFKGKEPGDDVDSNDSTKDTSSERNGNLGISSPTSGAQSDAKVSIRSKKSHPPTHHQPSTPITPQLSIPLFPWTSNHHHPHLTFAQHLRLACVERGLQFLSTPNLSLPEIHPALSLHLKRMSVHELRVLTEESLRGNIPQLDGYDPPAPIHPDMYRKIERNESVLMSRAPSRDVERLVFGRTRTVVEAAMPGFEGEWLEPSDVEEYLEEKGIRFGGPELPLIDHRSSSVDIFDSQPSVHTMSLQSLIEHLDLSAICIGPGPGMRRYDVDKALEYP